MREEGRSVNEEQQEEQKQSCWPIAEFYEGKASLFLLVKAQLGTLTWHEVSSVVLSVALEIRKMYLKGNLMPKE